jgi:hypothetical protein
MGPLQLCINFTNSRLADNNTMSMGIIVARTSTHARLLAAVTLPTHRQLRGSPQLQTTTNLLQNINFHHQSTGESLLKEHFIWTTVTVC